QRRFVFRIFADLIENFFFRFDELDLDVELARNFLNFCQEEKVVDEGKNARGSVFTLAQRLHVGDGSSAVAEAVALRALAILRAVAVVHGTYKGRAAALASIAIAMLTVLSAALSAPALALLILSVLGLMPEITFAAPLLPMSRIMRLVRSFI